MIEKFTPRRVFVTVFVFFIRLVFLLQVLLIFLPKIFFRTIRLSFSGRTWNPFKVAPEDVYMHQSDVVKLEGFDIQEFEFETPDHAFVSFWRVNKKSSVAKSEETEQSETQKTYGDPIIIQHGLIDSSITWFLQENKDKCLPFVMAAAGYDVWVGNNRGTKFSNRNSHKPGYWDYSIDQMIQYDLPTLIEGVLKTTGKKQLTYIGHSQGTYQFFAGLGIHPKLKYKIKRFIALGPVIGVKHIKMYPLFHICTLQVSLA